MERQQKQRSVYQNINCEKRDWPQQIEEGICLYQSVLKPQIHCEDRAPKVKNDAKPEKEIDAKRVYVVKDNFKV